jgi:16S rRNA (cytidine1402-2'-O)-methyltransferase
VNLKGKIYLIPCTLGTTNPIEVLPLLVTKTIENIDIFIAENEKMQDDLSKIFVQKKVKLH